MLDLVDAVALSLCFTASRRRVLEALKALPDCPFEVLVAWITRRPDASAVVPGMRDAAARALEAAGKRQIAAVGWGDARYPPLLAATPDAPVILWVRGRADLLATPSIAIVGSRAASPYGLEAAGRLAAEVAECGFTVVSGLARGIDSASHRGALDSGGATVAVLGSGVDVVYPPEHGDLAREIAERGVLVSELPPGTPPRPFHFPLRNRIISGLSRAVVVVEAAARSGSLITADCALEQGREVMAVPGSVLNGRHGGCHALLRDGAALVETGADILAALDVPGVRHNAGTAVTARSAVDPLVARMCAGETYDLDDLCALSGGSAVSVLTTLLELELRGAVRRVGGGRFVRSGGSC